MKKNLLLSLTMIALTAYFRHVINLQKTRTWLKKKYLALTTAKKYTCFTLTNKEGNVIRLTNYGAKINWIEVPDRNGKKDNITFGYDTFEETEKGDMSFGSTVGRYANRIAHGYIYS